MKKSFFFAAAAAALALSQTAGAQTNIQTFYDFGRGYATTTFEMFKGDSWGNTFFFVDHYYATADQRADQGCASAINGSYFEIERNINFWQDSALGALSAMVEYDGSTWGAGIFCVGASYFLHSDDFKNTYTLALLYDQHIGYGSANVPVKFSGVWGMQDLLGVKGLRFSGFIDIWGNNQTCVINPDPLNYEAKDTKFSILTEPQLWYNVGQHFGCENLHIGGEVELSFNFAGHYGFMCNPCLGAKWIF